MRFLYVGYLKIGQTSLMRLKALKRQGVQVVPFDVRTHLARQSFLERHVLSRFAPFAPNPTIKRLNESLLNAAREARPDYVWFDKPELITAETLNDIKALGVQLIYYTPDPYFSVAWKQTPSSKEALPLYDILITAKQYELERFGHVGGRVIYMPLGYCDEVHRPVVIPDQQARFDISFIGGWEPRREAFMEALAQSGHNVFIWGYGWDQLIDGRWTPRRYMRLRRLAPNDNHRIRRSDLLQDKIHPGEIYDEDYTRALSRSNVSLGLLRTTWPDQHTTRSFEIPACGSLLLADRTDEHQELFEEGKEADFFASTDELIDKAEFLARNPEARARMAAAGKARCEQSGYSYVARYAQIMPDLIR